MVATAAARGAAPNDQHGAVARPAQGIQRYGGERPVEPKEDDPMHRSVLARIRRIRAQVRGKVC